MPETTLRQCFFSSSLILVSYFVQNRPQILLSCMHKMSVWQPLAFHLNDLFDHNHAAHLSLEYYIPSTNLKQADCTLTVLPLAGIRGHLEGSNADTFTEQYGLSVELVNKIIQSNRFPSNRILALYRPGKASTHQAKTCLHNVATWLAQERGATVMREQTMDRGDIQSRALSAPEFCFELVLEHFEP